jgi:hypothetical protein
LKRLSFFTVFVIETIPSYIKDLWVHATHREKRLNSKERKVEAFLLCQLKREREIEPVPTTAKIALSSLHFFSVADSMTFLCGSRSGS